MTAKQSALTWIALLSVVLLLMYPMISENTKSTCHATEKIAIRYIVNHAPRAFQSAGEKLFTSGILGAMSTGDIAATYVKDNYPALPPALGCWLLWWKILHDPTEIKAIARELGI